MTRPKISVPLIWPDKTILHDDGVREYWVLWGFEGPGGLHPTGQTCHPDLRKQIIAERLAAARGERKS